MNNASSSLADVGGSIELVAPAPYVTIPLASAVTGLTPKAISRKIEDGVWIEGREYRRAPDGRIYVSISGFQKWVEKGTQSEGARSGFSSRGTASKSSTR